MPESVPVETIRPGDVIRLPVVGTRTVAEVARHGDELVVWYFAEEDTSYENKAQRKGPNRESRLVMKMVYGRPAGAPIPLEARGDPKTARSLRARMRREEAERFAGAEERYKRIRARAHA